MAEPAAAPQEQSDVFQGLWDTGAAPAQPPRPEPAAAQPEAPKPPEAETAPESAAPASEPPEAAPEPEYTNLDEFLAKQGIEPESFRSLPVKLKVDGRDMEVPLSDLIKNYGLEAHVQQRSQRVAEEQKAFIAEREAARQLVAQQLQGVQSVAQVAQQLLNADFQGVQWEQLRQTNPAEYAARLADYQVRQARINEMLGAVEAQRQQEAAQNEQNRNGLLAQERGKLLDARPEWRDQGAFAKAREQMVTYAKSLGFSDAELSQVLDHRAMLILHDAAQFRQLQASRPEALKRVRQAPKVAAPGARVNTNPKEVQRQQAIEQFRRNPKDVTAQEAVFDYLANA